MNVYLKASGIIAYHLLKVIGIVIKSWIWCKLPQILVKAYILAFIEQIGTFSDDQWDIARNHEAKQIKLEASFKQRRDSSVRHWEHDTIHC